MGGSITEFGEVAMDGGRPIPSGRGANRSSRTQPARGVSESRGDQKLHGRRKSPRPHPARDKPGDRPARGLLRRRSLRARSEEHTSELQSLMRISYAVFCLKKKKTTQ